MNPSVVAVDEEKMATANATSQNWSPLQVAG